MEEYPKVTTTKKPKSSFWEIAQTAILAFILAQILVRFVVQPHHVSGASMEPSFSDGDLILTDKLTYRFKSPQRGDIIVFHPPQNGKIEYIKRIIALPGDTVELRDNKVYVNNAELKENYLVYGNIGDRTKIQGADRIHVPENSFFVLGDNRDNSYDSRSFGSINKSDITGRAVLRYWPLNQVQAFGTPNFSQ